MEALLNAHCVRLWISIGVQYPFSSNCSRERVIEYVSPHSSAIIQSSFSLGTQRFHQSSILSTIAAVNNGGRELLSESLRYG